MRAWNISSAQGTASSGVSTCLEPPHPSLCSPASASGVPSCFTPHWAHLLSPSLVLGARAPLRPCGSIKNLPRFQHRVPQVV